jgi:hypothetical protein
LIAKGMASGPALALLLAGLGLSLPNMLIIRKVLGAKKTITYVSLVIAYSTIAGLIFGFYSEFIGQYGIRSLDSTVIIDKNGNIGYRDDTITTTENLEKIVKQLLEI